MKGELEEVHKWRQARSLPTEIVRHRRALGRTYTSAESTQSMDVHRAGVAKRNVKREG